MNKSIKKLANAKADKEDGAKPGTMRPLNRVKNLGGEDSPDQRRRLKAKPYRTERVSQTETPEMRTYEIHRGGDSEGNSIGWNEPATYHADNKGISAAMGRQAQEIKRTLKRYGYTDKEAGLEAVRDVNFRRDTTVKGSDYKKYEDSGWNPNSPGGRAVEGAEKKYTDHINKSVALGRRVDKRLYAKRASISPGAPIRQNEAYWNS